MIIHCSHLPLSLSCEIVFNDSTPFSSLLRFHSIIELTNPNYISLVKDKIFNLTDFIRYFRAKCRARAGDLCHVSTQLTAVGIRSKKNNLFFPICSSKLQSIMLRLDNASRERTIGMLQLGATQGDVARRLDLRKKIVFLTSDTNSCQLGTK
jgi:hypothetical protein